jgi:hypothetical protein
MMFDAQHNLTTERKPFQKQVTNRDETREFREAAKTFRAMLPILHAGCEGSKTHLSPMSNRTYSMCTRPEQIFDLYSEDAYPDIVAAFYADTWQETWRNLYRNATARMKVIVNVEEPQA